LSSKVKPHLASHCPAQPESAKKAEKQFARALTEYKRVLERGDGNVFAANGIGAVLAEQGHLGAARDIFNQVFGLRV